MGPALEKTSRGRKLGTFEGGKWDNWFERSENTEATTKNECKGPSLRKPFVNSHRDTGKIRYRTDLFGIPHFDATSKGLADDPGCGGTQFSEICLPDKAYFFHLRFEDLVFLVVEPNISRQDRREVRLNGTSIPVIRD